MGALCVEKIRHRCTTTGETFENVMATVKGSVKRKTLKNLATYVLKKHVDSVTDADIIGAVEARCRTLKNEFVPDVTSLFRQKLKMDLSIDDCDARVFRYYEDFNGIVEDNGLQGLIGAGDETGVGYKRRIGVTDYVAKSDSKSVKSDKKPQKAGTGKPAVTNAPPATVAPQGAPRAARPSRAPPQEGCLVCKGPQWLRDCPTATDAQREDAGKKYREAKEQCSGELRSKAARLLYLVLRSVSMACLKFLTLPIQSSLSTTPLSTHVDAKMTDGRCVRCSEEVLLDLELVTIAGTVSLKSVTCVVLPGDGDEFLLGRDALRTLGIDVEAQLTQLAGPSLFADDNDDFPVDDGLPEGRSEPEMNAALVNLMARAVANGLPEYIGVVQETLAEYADVWRETIGPGPPALVEPPRVAIQDGAIPHRSAPRRYAPLQAHAVVTVIKPGSRDQFRLTIDYRPVNSVTVPIAGSMPTSATASDAFAGNKVFASFDFTQGLWQLPLHKDSREMFPFITEDDVFTPNRVPQCATDSALHFQGEMQKVLAPLIPHSALVWMDDVTVDEFVQVLGQFFSLVAAAKLKQNMFKSKLFEVEVLWCGRLISGAGVRHDPARVSALSTLPLPAAEKLAAEKKRVGGRSRNALSAATTWSTAEQAAYEAMLALVLDSALMASPNPEAELLVFTELPVAKQQHEMDVCKGGMFKHNELNWTIVEKEAFPIVKTCQDLEYLLLRPKGFRLYCYHATWCTFWRHMIPSRSMCVTSSSAGNRLCGLHYVIEYITGEDNLWEDIVSRWHTREVARVAAVQTRSRHAAPMATIYQLRPLADDRFTFPTLDEIRENAGCGWTRAHPPTSHSRKEGRWYAGGRRTTVDPKRG
ncbi:hypothetical protein F443_10707 [Phytophthora nicotianae P1569]|uniref:Reverse transcriptase domain-containing protein n=1 Tax=Phytophthora nicotianae P1569 TaxID=1317065 RepID=V9EZ77_PHYNI|nr:hypothetical protein F443_10707 [Phytophthora nicotianae P1569]